MSDQNQKKLPIETIQECRRKLLQSRAEIINRIAENSRTFKSKGPLQGDEIDQSIELLLEDHLLIENERIRMQLLEIDYALSRMENGTYGICEETNELIEVARILALPATRFSIEGAEIQESHASKIRRAT